MKMLDHPMHSFVIKIWLEESAEESGQAVWRGKITHVDSGERHFVKSLDEISAFLTLYLEKMGVKPETRWLSSWLREKGL